MRFMMPVKSAENSGPPPKELMDAIGKLAEEVVQTGTMVESGGLAPTAKSKRVRLSRGQLTVIDGPFGLKLTGKLQKDTQSVKPTGPIPKTASPSVALWLRPRA